MTGPSLQSQPTAAFLIIGNEILSGRTQDTNLCFLGQRLSELGIRLVESRIVADETPAIIDAIHSLRSGRDTLFTSGGIGPTHDDITTAAVAEAFKRPLVTSEYALSELRRHYTDEELTEPRLKMTLMPEGAEEIPNRISSAPGFRIENVYVLAGVPSIFRAMFDELAPKLRRGPPIQSRSVRARAGESIVAAELGKIQRLYPAIDIGSYPGADENGYFANLVFRGRSLAEIDESMAALIAWLDRRSIAWRREETPSSPPL